MGKKKLEAHNQGPPLRKRHTENEEGPTEKETEHILLRSAYWLGQVEITKHKLGPLLELEEDFELVHMKSLQKRSQRSQPSMRLLLEQLIKKRLIAKIQEAKYYSIFVDKVTDCSHGATAYMQYVDSVNAHCSPPGSSKKRMKLHQAFFSGLMLNKALSPVNNLSKLFQKDHLLYKPSLDWIKAKL